MEVPWMYLMEVSVCLGVLYLLYVVAFRFTTFFTANRYYLLASVVFSFLMPAVELPLVPEGYEAFSTHPVATALSFQTSESVPDGPAPMAGGTMSYLALLYYAGLLIGFLRMGYSILGILRVKRDAQRCPDGRFRIFIADIRHPFSFLGLIFLPKGEIDPIIIEHEKAHVKQRHMIDLLMTELACVILWFNPLMPLYRRSVKAQHEYLADVHTIRDRLSAEHYLELLWRQIQVENSPGPVSLFYSQSIKNRIIMITRKKTSIRFYGLYLLLIPVSCLLLFAFSDKPSAASLMNPDTASGSSEFVIVVDPGHGGSDFGAHPVSGVVEKDLTMSIAMKMQEIARRNGLKVLLTREGDENSTLEERVSLAANKSVKMFVSLHVNTDTDAKKSGIECIVSESNPSFAQSRMLADRLVNELRKVEGIGVNGVLQSNFYVLINNSAPAVVLELGYLSNESDRAFIVSDENQSRLAEHILSAVVKHLK